MRDRAGHRSEIAPAATQKVIVHAAGAAPSLEPPQPLSWSVRMTGIWCTRAYRNLRAMAIWGPLPLRPAGARWEDVGYRTAAPNYYIIVS
jgi:hypothetical protein